MHTYQFTQSFEWFFFPTHSMGTLKQMIRQHDTLQGRTNLYVNIPTYEDIQFHRYNNKIEVHVLRLCIN